MHTAIDRKDPYVKRCVAVGGDVVEMRAGNSIHQWQTRSSKWQMLVQRFYSYLISFRNQDIDYFMEKSCPIYRLQMKVNQRRDCIIIQFQGIGIKDLLAQIKVIPEFVKAEEVLKGKWEQFLYYPVLDEKRSICK